MNKNIRNSLREALKYFRRRVPNPRTRGGGASYIDEYGIRRKAEKKIKTYYLNENGKPRKDEKGRKMVKSISYINAYGSRVHVSTGNMANNATQLIVTDNESAKLIVDQKIAPYVPYTNEPWISPRWNGKKNPNEGWFDKAADMFAYDLSAALEKRFGVKNVTLRRIR